MVTASASRPPITLGGEQGLAESLPEHQGIPCQPLIELTDWIRTSGKPIYSLLISRHGKLVYELYTSGLSRDPAHYLMSVTKSVVSALIGIAIGTDLSLLERPIPDLLSRAWFLNDADVDRMRVLNLRQVMGMSALDNPDPPRDRSGASYQRMREFLEAPNRTAVALSRPLLAHPGMDFQYNDENPMIATAFLAAHTGMSAFDFAVERLFRPLGFQNAEWMHQDKIGNDMGGYGLRLRPIDMQKFGNLYLRSGVWEGRQILPVGWVQLSVTPWIRSSRTSTSPNYGWYWWRHHVNGNLQIWAANGWRGQRIFIVPEADAVITITGDIQDGLEDDTIRQMLERWILPAISSPGPSAASMRDRRRLAQLMTDVRQGQPRWSPTAETRMVPSAAPLEGHHGLVPPI